MAAGDMTPEREEQLMADLLRERVGIDPGKVGPLVDLAAIGLVNGAWRNACVENWHAEGRMHDGDMLRVNSHTTWRVRQLMRRWMREGGLDAAAPTSALDGVAADNVWWLARRMYQWLASPSHMLPIGATLAQLARDDLAEYEDDADERLSAFGAHAEERGARFGFARTAAHGGLACSHGGDTRTGRPRYSGAWRHLTTRPMTTGGPAASTEPYCPPSPQTSPTVSVCADSCCSDHGS